MSKVALVAGATGLIGGQLLELLLADGDYSKVIVLSRRSLSIKHDRLQIIVSEIDQYENLDMTVDDVFCCLGTTMKNAKTKEAFLKVDYEAPLALAKKMLSAGAHNFLLISALGANKNSSIFYNQVKGKTEEAIGALPFKSFHIFRPSLLLGPRNEQRTGEEAAKVFYRLFGWLIPKKFKGIESVKVARAMLAKAKESKQGIFIHESSELQNY